MGAAAAVIRTADAMLRSAGGRRVKLRMPAPAIAGDVAEQVGLGQPQFQDYVLGPVTFRKIRGQVSFDETASVKAAGFEMLVSAAAVLKLVGSLEFESASVLFRDAAGVLVGETLMRVDSCTEVEMFGGVVLYRLLLQTPLALVD